MSGLAMRSCDAGLRSSWMSWEDVGVVFEVQGLLWCAGGKSLDVVRADWVQMCREGKTWWLRDMGFYGLTGFYLSIWHTLIYLFSTTVKGFIYSQNPFLQWRSHNKYARFYFISYVNSFFLSAEDYDFIPWIGVLLTSWLFYCQFSKKILSYRLTEIYLQTGYEGDGKTCTQVDICSINNGGCHPLATCTSAPGMMLS